MNIRDLINSLIWTITGWLENNINKNIIFKNVK